MKEKILNTLIENNYKYRVYGIRTENRALKVGEPLGCSHAYDFENNVEFEDKFYDGICATGFGYLWYDEDDVDEVEKTLALQSGYVGDHQYLVGGDEFEYGNDDGEVIIQNAVVLAILR